MSVEIEPSATPRRLRLTAILAALIGGIFILALKFYAASLANSSALRSDALEATVNVLAAAFGLGSLLFSEKPADRDHPYGHGKIEYFASVFEGGLISLAGFLILIDTVHRLLQHEEITNLGMGLKINLFAGLLNGVLGFLIYRTGKRTHSLILISDGVHLLTDLVSTIVLGIGLIVVYFTHWTWIDPLLALGVAFFLFKTGFQLVNESSGALLDAENPDLLKKIVEDLNSIPRGVVITAHELRAQQFGRDKHVDLHLVVPEYLSVKEAHDSTSALAYTLREKLGYDSVVHTHVDPCEQSFCEECDEENCPIRVEPLRAVKPFTVESITQLGKH